MALPVVAAAVGLRTRIHKRFNKVCKWEIITIDSEEETENS